ncbi:type II secretion system protein GspG [uncultured Alcanivorax sp.]|jgi:energy-coupling factor transporter transmembrane protein EcfT|uniref:type II secretion system protein GspG n=1 Tax=uncultured Alcanivorax sp. TaxID=191215 RepID=UPI00258F4956|nr:type II secretion system protein GspG [uncultured Alcanivorax sp.]
MNHEQEKLGTFPFVIGGVSFIPGIGIIFGIIAIIWGLVTKKLGGKKLAIIGACGIGFSIILYALLFYFGFVQRGGVYDDLRVQLSKNTITSLVQAIEFYKTQNGQYPESLEALRKSLPENSMVFVHDPTDVQMGGEPRYYHYELQDQDHYYLLGVGPDGQPYTNDDVLPNIEINQNSGVGLLIPQGSKNGL